MALAKAKSWDTSTAAAGFLWDSPNPKANLMLQHGLGEYSERYVWQYNQLIPKLVARGFNVYAIDLPGHGESAGVRGLVDLNEALMLHLSAREAIDPRLPLVLMGHSLGGLVTAASVVSNPSGIAAAVISSSAMQQPSKRWERLLSKLVTSINPEGDMPLPRPGEECLTRDLELLKLIAADDKMYHGKARNLVAKTVLEISDMVWDRIDQWNVPTLVIHGDKDLSTNHQNSIRLYNKIPAVDKTLRIYEGGYHELLNDLDKALVERELFEWLQSRI
ncbi:lysophospholipase [Aquiluna sp. KACHI24]|uniref:lysophospholipase n=1 Tax=Aquiluna sp. KACHI24 TaxID=2968831 RepID=UPI0021FA56AD|nr:lysophospholipase [Aquiluna sp. KACHI24]BDQ00797.1 hydrolase [Aquiluna sp. KACHI24]